MRHTPKQTHQVNRHELDTVSKSRIPSNEHTVGTRDQCCALTADGNLITAYEFTWRPAQSSMSTHFGSL
eukprot:1160111-Pelagomonas_calceolata.AAC.4